MEGWRNHPWFSVKAGSAHGENRIGWYLYKKGQAWELKENKKQKKKGKEREEPLLRVSYSSATCDAWNSVIKV